MLFGGFATTMGLVLFSIIELVALYSARKFLLKDSGFSNKSFYMLGIAAGVINLILIMLNEKFYGYGGNLEIEMAIVIVGLKAIIETLIIAYMLKIPRSEAIIPGVISNVLCFFAVGFIFPKVGGYIDDRVTFLLGFNLFIIFLIMIPVLFFSLNKLLHKDG